MTTINWMQKHHHITGFQNVKRTDEDYVIKNKRPEKKNRELKPLK